MIAFQPRPQIHRLFEYEQVKHLIKPMFPDIRVNRIELSDIQLANIGVCSTRSPKHAICAMNEKGMHFFLHDAVSIRRCVWDGHLSLCDKKETLTAMLKWLQMLEDIPIAEDLADFEDRTAMSEAIEEVGILVRSDEDVEDDVRDGKKP